MDHKGYQTWHRELDDTAVAWIKNNQNALYKDFVDMMNDEYAKLAGKFGEVVFQRKSSDPTPPPDYYDLLFVRSRVTINHQESKIKYLHNYVDKPICPVCCPVGRLSHEYYELVYNMEEYEGYDIFHTWERGGTVFVSQKFLDMWKEEKLTGLWYSTAENPKERFTLG